ncbi:MAG: VOC family protein [Pseudomonadota bacterium]
MEKVVGIGGIFIRSKNPEALTAWYETHLGITINPPPWMQAGGPTVFAPFPADSDYFPKDRAFMLNFRVGNLDALMAQLEGAGIAVETRPDWDSEIGRFARIHDPEGTPIELWEPAGAAKAASE